MLFNIFLLAVAQQMHVPVCVSPYYFIEQIEIYSGGYKTLVKTLKAYISHNKAKNPINFGAN